MKASRCSIISGLVAVLLCFATPTAGSAISETSTVTDSLSLAMLESKARDINSLSSLLIQQDGRLLAEYYYHGMDAGESTNIKSASKSIISLLIGIAVDHGFFEGINQEIEPFFEDHFQAHPDSVKENLTLKNLLTMRAGMETTSFHNYGQWVISDNWVHFALSQPIVEKPGTDMVYSTGSSHLLSVILTKASGMNTRNFAQKYLFGPMDIQVGGWDRDPQGYFFGGNNLALRPSDMLKIGQMVLSGGCYQGERIISEDWLEKSFKTYTRSNYNPYDYGFMWWKKQVGNFKVRFAWGYGGQYIFIIPELEGVVVMTGRLAGATQSRSYKEPVFVLLREHILPLLRHRYAEQSGLTVSISKQLARAEKPLAN